jgi:ubiquinone/menaquinone biosynthesis C-methylase UbiE
MGSTILARLNELEASMSHFYQHSDNYYEDIDFTNSIWQDKNQLPQQDILSVIAQQGPVLEVGCGSANILRAMPTLAGEYYGCDFSEQLMEQNQQRYPQATFRAITNPKQIPFESGKFGVVFSHFVIEHVIYPAKFLEECSRCLMPGGTLVVLCPSFLGRGNITSQVVGLGPGTGREKWQRGQFYDAILTSFDNKVRFPLWAAYLKFQMWANKKPLFLINLAPKCLDGKYEFMPDYDAVYLTYEWEMRQHLADQIEWHSLSAELGHYCQAKHQLYLKGKKRP